jgi:hypothetical protein
MKRELNIAIEEAIKLMAKKNKCSIEVVIKAVENKEHFAMKQFSEILALGITIIKKNKNELS